MSDTEAEDRTQAPSKQRRMLAREQGQVAQSKELTAAFGLLGASVVLWVWGQDLAVALLTTLREPFLDLSPVRADPSQVVSHLRLMAFLLARPVVLALSGYALAAFVAHQVQVRGLWAPGLIAPDAGRLWKAGQGPGIASHATTGIWGLLKASLIAILAAWMVYSEWPRLVGFSAMEIPALARASGLAVCRLLLVLSIALFLLGLLDYTRAHLRFEAALRTTPDQQRQELRSMDGDPSLKARRRQIAKAWRLDSGEVLQGAALLVEGDSGLTIVIEGGPPPKPARARAILVGASGDRLRKAAERNDFPTVHAPEVARRIAGRRPPNLPFSPEIMADLAPIWARKASRG